MAIDYSFIRLKNSKEKAFDLSDSPIIKHEYVGQVQLLPFDTQPYLQITNSDDPIVIEDFQVFVVDCFDNEFEITDNVFIYPFINSKGIAQIAFEIINIQKDFGTQPVYLRFDQLNGESFYSNQILITEEEKELTTRIDYTSKCNVYGIEYEVASFYQSIRVQVYFNTYVSQDEIDVYYQISASQNVNTRANISDLQEWITREFNGFTYKRLKRALYQECYFNLVRVYATEGLEFEPREEEANISQSRFLIDPDEENIFSPFYQIAEEPTVIQLTPPDDSENPVFTDLIIQFDQVVQQGSGGVQVYQNGVPVGAKKETFGVDLTLVGDTLTIDASDITFTDGFYYALVNQGIVNINGIVDFAGFNSSTQWNWSIIPTTVQATITPRRFSSAFGDLFGLRVEFISFGPFVNVNIIESQIGMIVNGITYNQSIQTNSSSGNSIDVEAQRGVDGQLIFSFSDTRIFLQNGVGNSLRYSYTAGDIAFTEAEILNETSQVVTLDITPI